MTGEVGMVDPTDDLMEPPLPLEISNRNVDGSNMDVPNFKHPNEKGREEQLAMKARIMVLLLTRNDPVSVAEPLII